MVAKLISAAVACALAAPAFAEIPVPDPNCCDVPCAIAVVGTNGGVPDPAGAFTVIVRSFNCDPLVNSTVWIDFTECAPDIYVCGTQPDAHRVDCPTRSVYAISNALGRASFTIVGGAKNPSGNAPGYAGPTFCGHAGTIACAKVYADGVLLAKIGVSAYDQNLAGGVNPADISAWLADAFSGTYYGRSDYDASATLAPPDLSKLLGVALGGGSTSSCAVYCE
jgi:hypothetical protein